MLRPLFALLDSIKFAHSVFALPFALLAMIVAAQGWPSWRIVGLILLCMVSARSAAMAFNRLADLKLDAANPRTRLRPSVTGQIPPWFLALFTVLNAGLFLTGAWLLNTVCLIFAPAVLVWLLGYSYAKRFTSLCHFWLGLALALAPIGAHLAVRGDLAALPDLGARWALNLEIFPLILALGVVCWVSGFDLIYACQDYQVDCANPRLHSLPKRLGLPGALRLSSVLHAAATALLVAAGIYAGMGIWYFMAMGAAGALLVYEHWIVSPTDLSRVNAAFFTLNGLVSLLLLLAVLLERVWLAPI